MLCKRLQRFPRNLFDSKLNKIFVKITETKVEFKYTGKANSFRFQTICSQFMNGFKSWYRMFLHAWITYLEVRCHKTQLNYYCFFNLFYETTLKMELISLCKFNLMLYASCYSNNWVWILFGVFIWWIFDSKNIQKVEFFSRKVKFCLKTYQNSRKNQIREFYKYGNNCKSKKALQDLKISPKYCTSKE